MTGQLLHAEHVPLTGLHLIEASAGTGKTYNITRLYLRLLLEKKLSVEQILVMTFTKDATQELRGRIDDTLRNALQHWSALITEDEFYRSLATRITEQEAKLLLKKALLFIDEAAIFTIHGFCQRVLSQYAFNAQISLDASLSADMYTPMLQAVQDWYRQLAKQEPDAFLTLAECWQTPNKFVESFAKAVFQQAPIHAIQENEIKEKFSQLVTQALADIEANHALITEALIDSKTGKAKETRVNELASLTQWLSLVIADVEHAYTDIPATFANKSRFTAQFKTQLLTVFEHFYHVKEQQKKLASQVAKAQAFQVALQGIEQIKLLMELSKAQQNILGFDDLVSKLAHCVKQDQGLAQQLLRDYPVALVDEFQDTDADQYTIVNQIYGQSPHACVFMIGDPKQAIYGFRGGDVFAYLAARKQCQYQWLMDTNWRSSAGMINGYNRLFYGNELTEPSANVFKYTIDYYPVKASPKAKPELTCSHDHKPLQIIDFVSDETVRQSQRITMARWCANEISRLLDEKDDLSAHDFAVLVRDTGEANQIKQALSELGLTSVFLSNRDNLYQSREAKQLFTLLKGLLYLENEQLYTNALTTMFLGYQPHEYVELQQDELAWQQLKQAFDQLREVWSSQGFMPMALRLLHDYVKLTVDEQDRTLTNILHLFELLQEASTTYRLPHELLFWFEQQLQIEQTSAEAELRLESDANLIKIVTQHGSKGLEYPVVFIPFATRYKHPLKVGARIVNLIEYHQDNGHKSSTLGGNETQKQAMIDEAHAESIRLLYVAVTRAEQRCYILSSNFDGAHHSPLGLTLAMTANDDLSACLMTLSQSQADIGYQAVAFDNIVFGSEPLKQDMLDKHTQNDLTKAAKFTGNIERDWWLSSFTALSRNMRHQGVSNPDRDEITDDILLETSAPELRFTLTKGAQTGNLLHEMLEYNDFSSPDWQTSLVKNQKRFQDIIEPAQFADLANWLDDIVSTPLVADNADFTLASLSCDKMIRECEFYFPMEQAKLSLLIELLSTHRKENKHRLARYNKKVFLPYIKQLQGMMHGFIDLVFEQNGKFYVCDYKSSHLGDNFEHYQPEHLAENIEEHHYDLQYLIYSLALHRYLQNQLPDYQVDKHFGGIYYLYLRGMTAAKGTYSGVYHREVSAKELAQLDNIFSGKTMINASEA